MKTFRYIHEWTHPTTNLVFHTFPMIHIGSKSYYENVSTMISEMNFVLTEGVPLKRRSEIGSYVKFARRLGLASQQEELKIPEDLPSLNIDIGKLNFKKEYGRLPISDKFKMWFFDLFLKSYRPKHVDLFLERLYQRFSYSDIAATKLIDPHNHYASAHSEKTRLELLIENKRDQVIKENLDRYIEENRLRPFRLDVGILFGDGHMPHIYRVLLERKYRWKLETKVMVF